MKKRITYFSVIFFGLLPVILSGQKLHVHGKVTDTTGEVLPFANFMVLERSRDSTSAFYIGNEHGSYGFYLKAGKSYQVKVYYLGYKTMSFDIDSNQVDVEKNVVMIPDYESLDAVELLVRMPVRIKEDSVIYVADSFRSGREWKLKDLVKKLPGMEITKEGNIRVMGKTVSKVLVEDKPFFGGNPRMALENIPADAVDQIEAVDDYTDIGFMRQVNDENKLILNIKLKKGKERFFFGDITAAAGTRNKYLLNPHIYHYAPHSQTGFIGYAGNTDNNPVTMKEIMTLQNGMNNFRAGEVVKTFRLFSPLFEGDFYKKKDRMATLQWHQDKGKNTLSILGLAFRQNAANYSRQFLLRQSTGYTEKTDQSGEKTVQAGVIKIDWRHKSNVWNYVDIHHTTSFNRQDSNQKTDGLTDQDNFSMSEEINKKHFLSETEGVWYKKMNRHWIFRLNIRHAYTTEEKQDNFLSSYPIFNDIIHWANMEKFPVKDSSILKINELNSVVKLYYLMTNRFHIYFTGGFSNERNEYLSAAWNRISDTLSWNSLKNEGFDEHLSGHIRDYSSSIQLKYTTRRFLVRGGWKWYRWKSPFRSRDMFYPFFYLRKRFGKSRTFIMQFDGKPGQIDFPDLGSHFYITGIRMIKKGNPDLTPDLTYRFGINFRDFSISKKYSFFAGLSYSYVARPLSSRIVYLGPSAVREMFVNTRPSKDFRYYASIKYFFKDFYVQLQYNRFETYFFKQFNRNEMPIGRYTGKFYFKTGLLGWERLDWNMEFVWQHIRQQTGSSEYISYGYEFNTDLSYSVASGFDLHAEYFHKRLNQLNALYGAQVRFSYKDKTDKWRLYLSGYNLFGNPDRYFRFENDTYYESEIRRMPSFWLIGFVRRI